MSESTTFDGAEMARSLRPVTAEEAEPSEKNRTLTEREVDALWASGLMQWFNPSEAGGQEPSFTEMIETWIELAWQDGSLGWIGIANMPSTASSAAYLPDDGFKEVFVEHDNRVTMGGQFFPNGLGEDTGDAYRITGSWNFGSGTGHSQYVAAGFIPTVNGEMVTGDDGIPQLMVGLIPKGEVTFTDGWYVQGLKGTGSYDYNVKDHDVPKWRTYRLFERSPKRGKSAAFHLGLIPITAAGHASWALGVSKSMLDDVIELAQTKVRMGGRFVDRPPQHVPARAGPPPSRLAGRQAARHHDLHRRRALSRQWRGAHAGHASRAAGGRHLRHRVQPAASRVGSSVCRHVGHP